jgi:hypothetical protein
MATLSKPQRCFCPLDIVCEAVLILGMEILLELMLSNNTGTILPR